MSKKLTPWFPASVKPARVGVYQRNFGSANWFSYWDGLVWGFTEKEVRDAHAIGHICSNYQDKPWRGLAQPPKE